MQQKRTPSFQPGKEARQTLGPHCWFPVPAELQGMMNPGTQASTNMRKSFNITNRHPRATGMSLLLVHTPGTFRPSMTIALYVACVLTTATTAAAITTQGLPRKRKDPGDHLPRDMVTTKSRSRSAACFRVSSFSLLLMGELLSRNGSRYGHSPNFRTTTTAEGRDESDFALRSLTMLSRCSRPRL